MNARRTNPGVAALKAESRPGCCIACDEPLPPKRGAGRKRLLCGKPECERLYNTAHHIGRAVLRREERAR